MMVPGCELCDLPWISVLMWQYEMRAKAGKTRRRCCSSRWFEIEAIAEARAAVSCLLEVSCYWNKMDRNTRGRFLGLREVPHPRADIFSHWSFPLVFRKDPNVTNGTSIQQRGLDTNWRLRGILWADGDLNCRKDFCWQSWHVMSTLVSLSFSFLFTFRTESTHLLWFFTVFNRVLRVLGLTRPLYHRGL